MHRFSDPARSADGSRKRRRRCCLPPVVRASAPRRQPISGLHSPAYAYPYRRFAVALTDDRRTARGHRGSLLLRCRALSSPSPCRFIPAPPQHLGIAPSRVITRVSLVVITPSRLAGAVHAPAPHRDVPVGQANGQDRLRRPRSRGRTATRPWRTWMLADPASGRGPRWLGDREQRLAPPARRNRQASSFTRAARRDRSEGLRSGPRPGPTSENAVPQAPRTDLRAN